MLRLCIFFLLASYSIYAHTGSVKKLIKEQVVSQPLEYTFKKVFGFININYFMTLKQTNRVHSATRGKGIKVKIKNFQTNAKFSVVPINAIGVQKSLFESNLLFPGSYKLIAKKGTKLGKLNVSKNIMIDYYQLIKATGVKSDLNFGRLEVNLKPTKAKVKIDNYDIPYNSGMQLPVGDYRISISEAGYNASTKKVSISKNKITKINVSLKALSSKPKAKPLVLVSKLPIVVAKPQNERKEKPIKIQDKVHVNDSVERITVVGRLVPRDILFHFELNNKLRDRVTLVIDNEQIEPIKIRKKTRNKTFVLEAEILPGKYRAKLYTKKHGDFDLGEVEIKNQSINNLNYFLTLH